MISREKMIEKSKIIGGVMAKNAIVKKEPEVPALFQNTGDYTGLENIKPEDLKQPFLQIAKETVLGSDDKPIVRGGDFVHSVTKEVLGNNINFIVLRIEPGVYIEWNGTQFQARWNSEREAREAGRFAKTEDGFRYTTPEGYRIQKTDYYYGIIPGRPDLGVMIFTLKSTGAAISRDWLTEMFGLRHPSDSSKQAPVFFSVWNLKTHRNVNDNGEAYYQVKEGKKSLITRVGWSYDYADEIQSQLEFIKSLDTTKIVEKSDNHDGFPDEDNAEL